MTSEIARRGRGTIRSFPAPRSVSFLNFDVVFISAALPELVDRFLGHLSLACGDQTQAAEVLIVLKELQGLVANPGAVEDEPAHFLATGQVLDSMIRHL